MNTDLIKKLVAKKTSGRPLICDESKLAPLSEFLSHPEIGEYLRYCLPSDMVSASGIRLLTLDSILQEMSNGSAPGSFISPFGYIIVATSIGGNAVCVHSPSGRVFWADHTGFGPDSISFKDAATGKWKYHHQYTRENVSEALVPLSDNFEVFLIELLEDRLESQLDALD
jgi:hypothetical protein